MIDSAIQRTNMVESQIRPSDVTDRRILRAMADIPREGFVPAGVASLAYMDGPVPLASPRRALMAPRTFARLVQLMGIEATDRVLIVGCGTGYGAAIVSRLAGSVIALECEEALASVAKTNLAGHSNVTVATGPLPDGAAAQGPYQVILVEGAVWERPALLSQLAPSGRLAAILNDGSVSRATLWRRVGDVFGATPAFDAVAGDLPGFKPRATFVF